MSTPRVPAWTDQRTDLVKRRWADGLSASQIAKEVNATPGPKVSRNAVIGKVHRLGLSGRASPSRPRRAERRTFVRPPATPRMPRAVAEGAPETPRVRVARDGLRVMAPIPNQPLPAARPYALTGEECRIEDLTPGRCKFGLNDPGRGRMDEMLCCGQPAKVEGGRVEPYCEHHFEIACPQAEKASGRKCSTIANELMRSLRRYI
jgi:GcrA cell cycle regulator